MTPKFFLFLAIFILLTACAPAATEILATQTVTPAPSATPIPPTATPDLRVSGFIVLDGKIYADADDGVLVEQDFGGDLRVAKLSFSADNTLLALDESGAEVARFVNDVWMQAVKVFSADEILAMVEQESNGKLTISDENKLKLLDAAPQADEFGNVKAVLNNQKALETDVKYLGGNAYIVYRDAEGLAVSVFNSVTGEMTSAVEAGVVIEHDNYLGKGKATEEVMWETVDKTAELMSNKDNIDEIFWLETTTNDSNAGTRKSTGITNSMLAKVKYTQVNLETPVVIGDTKSIGGDVMYCDFVINPGKDKDLVVMTSPFLGFAMIEGQLIPLKDFADKVVLGNKYNQTFYYLSPTDSINLALSIERFNVNRNDDYYESLNVFSMFGTYQVKYSAEQIKHMIESGEVDWKSVLLIDVQAK